MLPIPPIIPPFKNSGSNVILRDINKKVGIGTNNPTSLLHLGTTFDNDPVTPTLSLGDGDTGIYEIADDNLGFAIGGVQRFNFLSSRLVAQNGACISTSLASDTVPVLIPSSAVLNTGIGITGNVLCLISEGTNIANISNVGVGIGTTVPTQALTLAFPKKIEIWGTANQTTTNYSSLQIYHTGDNAIIKAGGKPSFPYSKPLLLQSIYETGNESAPAYIKIQRALNPFITMGVGTTSIYGNVFQLDITSIASSNMVNIFDVSAVINQSGTAGFTSFRISPYIMATGSGNKYLLDIGTNTAALGAGTHTSKIVVNSSGYMGIGITAPTAVLHLKAGTATAGTAPLKLTSGTSLGTPENGAVEYDGSRMYLTVSSSRKTIAYTDDIAIGFEKSLLLMGA